MVNTYTPEASPEPATYTPEATPPHDPLYSTVIANVLQYTVIPASPTSPTTGPTTVYAECECIAKPGDHPDTVANIPKGHPFNKHITITLATDQFADIHVCNTFYTLQASGGCLDLPDFNKRTDNCLSDLTTLVEDAYDNNQLLQPLPPLAQTENSTDLNRVYDTTCRFVAYSGSIVDSKQRISVPASVDPTNETAWLLHAIQNHLVSSISKESDKAVGIASFYFDLASEKYKLTTSNRPKRKFVDRKPTGEYELDTPINMTEEDFKHFVPPSPLDDGFRPTSPTGIQRVVICAYGAENTKVLLASDPDLFISKHNSVYGIQQKAADAMYEGTKLPELQLTQTPIAKSTDISRILEVRYKYVTDTSCAGKVNLRLAIPESVDPKDEASFIENAIHNHLVSSVEHPFSKPVAIAWFSYKLVTEKYKTTKRQGILGLPINMDEDVFQHFTTSDQDEPAAKRPRV